MAWNRNVEEDKAPGRRTTSNKATPVRMIVAAVAVVVAVGAVALFVLSGGERTAEKPVPPPEAEKPGDISAPAKPVAKPVDAPVAERPVSTNAPAWNNAVGLDPSLFPYTDGRKVISTRTNTWDQVIDICIMPNGRSRKVIRSAKPPVFEFATDQIIALAISGGDDQVAPPLPLGSNLEADFFESMKKPIVIREDDSDEIRQLKENVMEARKTIEEELRKGKSFKDILSDHVAQRQAIAEMRAEARDAVRELKQDGDPEMVNEYLKRVNGLLKEKGAGEITMPKTHKERMAEKLQL